MYSVSYDKDRRLLRLKFSRVVDRVQGVSLVAEVREVLRQAPAGFRLLTDLSELESMDLACEPFIDETMDAFNRAGIALVVRVVTDARQDIGFGIMSVFHYGKNVRIITCSTLEEAEAELDRRGSTDSQT